MGKIDIKLAYEIMHHTRTYMRYMWKYWKANMTIECAVTLIVVLYQYVESWTTIVIQQEYVREYYINKSKISNTVSVDWRAYAEDLHSVREQVCHNFGSIRCKNELKKFMKSMHKLQQFMSYLGVLDSDDL